MDPPLDPPDETVRRAVLARAGSGTGRLGTLAAWFAACRGGDGDLDAAPRRARLVLFGDPAAATGPVEAWARAADIGVRTVTADPADPLPCGRDAADREVDEGADLLLGAERGSAVTAAAAAVAAMTGREPVAVVGSHPGTDGRHDDTLWADRVTGARDLLRHARPAGRDPVALLARIGDPDLAALTGFLAQAARRRTPAVIDGPVTGAAALLADALAPGARAWWLAGSASPDPAAAAALETLGLDPLLDLGVRTGSGGGAVAAVTLLRAAVAGVAEAGAAAEAGGVAEAAVPR